MVGSNLIHSMVSAICIGQSDVGLTRRTHRSWSVRSTTENVCWGTVVLQKNNGLRSSKKWCVSTSGIDGDEVRAPRALRVSRVGNDIRRRGDSKSITNQLLLLLLLRDRMTPLLLVSLLGTSIYSRLYRIQIQLVAFLLTETSTKTKTFVNESQRFRQLQLWLKRTLCWKRH